MNIGYLIEETEKSQCLKSVVVYIGFKTTARSQILNFELSNGQLIFYVRYKQSILVEIYATNIKARFKIQMMSENWTCPAINCPDFEC